jgi:flagellum-specific peptidoglycan hydrolase FlgJ
LKYKNIYTYKIDGTAIKISRKFLLLIFISGFFLAASAQSQYIQKYSELADSLSVAYGIPTAVILGVAILESSFGRSRSCKLLNNHFGIVGRNNLWRTKGIKSVYKQYPDSRSSFIDFCRLITTKRFYHKLNGKTDYKLWIVAISKAKYSEVPEIWKTRVLSVIKKNKLSVATEPR